LARLLVVCEEGAQHALDTPVQRRHRQEVGATRGPGLRRLDRWPEPFRTTVSGVENPARTLAAAWTARTTPSRAIRSRSASTTSRATASSSGCQGAHNRSRVGWGGAVPAFRELFSSLFIPSASEEQKRWYDDMQRVSSTGEVAARLWKSRVDIDVSDAARRATQPALVVHARKDRVIPYEEGRRLASLLPNARLVTLDTDNHVLQEDEPAWEVFLSEVRAFLGDEAPAGDLAELSERERDVLELVAAGMSNEQIAERLSLSPRTVERHLSNIYAKLRLSGKSARAAAAARFSRA
jgi:DNA-binding CsgD family transcriptional regulator